MKEGWKYKKLGEVATFARGLTYSKKDEVESSKNVVLRSNNIDLLSGKLDFSELKYLDEDFEIPADKRVKQGSLFICMSNGSKAHLGKVAYIDKDYNYAFGGFMGQITPNNDVDGLYLHYALSSPLYKDYIKSLSEGANINNLKFKDLSEFIIGYPSLDEQHSIVSHLDAAFAKIDALKANAERQLAEARALFNRALTEEMTPKEGWEKKTLGEVCIKSKNIKWDTIDEDKSFIYIDLTSVDRTDLQIHNPQIVNKHNAPSRAKQIVKTGDVIFATTRPTLRRVSLIDEQFDSNICSTGFCVLRPGKDVVSEWIFYALQEVSFYNYIEPLQAGANYPAVTDSDVKNYAIPIPPITNQHSIVARLDAIFANVRKLEELQRKTLLVCDALKQAMLKEVFE